MSDKLKEDMNEALGFHPDSETDFVSEIVRLRQEVRDTFHALTKAEQRKSWWVRNAEAIAKERGELFRAGEVLRASIAYTDHRSCAAVTAWDEAAQPLRDMVASIKSELPNVQAQR